jgi:hypothetical protein
MKVVKIFFLIMFCVILKMNSQNHYVVTSNNDPVNPFNPPAGSLRWAIEQANLTPGLDYIDFNISMTAPVIIQLNSNLPPISDVVIMDGSTQPANGYTGNNPKIAIKGDLTPNNISYILSLYQNQPWETPTVDASLSEIKNLKLYESDGYIILLSRVNGVKLLNNVIHSSNGYGVRFSGASNSIVKGNIFGTDNTFAQSSYLALQGGNLINNDNSFLGDGNKIGGINTGEANYFYNIGISSSSAIIVGGFYNKISGNIFIGNSKNINLDPGKGCYGNICHQPPVFQGIFDGTSTNITGTAGANDIVEVYKTNATSIDAVQLIGTATANGSGQWSLTTTGLNTGDELIATATDASDNTSEFSNGVIITAQICCTNLALNLKSETGNTESPCAIDSFYVFAACGNINYTWNFGNGQILNTIGVDNIAYAYNAPGTYTLTVTANATGNCPAVTDTKVLTVQDCRPPCVPSFIFEGYHPTSCTNQEICFVSHPRICTQQNQQNFVWNFGDGSPTVTGCGWCHTYTTAGTYSITVTVSGADCQSNSAISSIVVTDCTPPPPCEDCIGSFAPLTDKKYVISAWVKEENAPNTKTTYSFPSLIVESPSVGFVSASFTPEGAIIDGWQRIEGKFSLPTAANDISINLNCSSPTGDCYFDDIRVFPMDGSMKSYVYDPVNMRLVAELDERNYATLYEYDEEGKLVRVKKETEKGIMTIKESRNNSSK